jgi:hypothetical protein
MPGFSKIGKCIWCLKGKPDATFNHAPHTISKQLHATNIGFDICDSCNDYFGKKDKTKVYPMTIELAFKEINSDRLINCLLQPRQPPCRDLKVTLRRISVIYGPKRSFFFSIISSQQYAF